MKLVLAVTTFDRLDYLRRMLESWEDTRDPTHDWTVVVADDGSPRSTLEYLKPYHVIRNARRGIHHQVNSLLKYVAKQDFDYAFRADDDIIFKKSGWDNAYVDAIRSSGYDHLVFHDPEWKRVKRSRPPVFKGSLESRSYWDDVQGAFWTFTKRVVSTVGYIDVSLFGHCGFGHRDYTYRCCKTGFNHLLLDEEGTNACNCVYDLRGSNEYLELIKENYSSASWDLWLKWNLPKAKERKINSFCDSRVYVPYRELNVDIEGRIKS